MGLAYAGLDQLIINGPLSSGLLILAIIPLVISIHMGIRLGLVSFVLTLIVAAGALYIWSRVPADFEPVSNLQFLLAIIAPFALAGIAGQLSLSRLANQIELAKNRESALRLALDHEAQRFNQRVQTRTETIKISSQIGQTIASILSETELVETVVSSLQQEKGYLHTAIYLKDDYVAFDTLQLAADKDRDGNSLVPKGYRLPINSGIFKKVFEEGRAFWITDLPNSDYIIPGDPSPIVAGEMAVPIQLGNEIIGVIDIRQDDERPLDLDDAFLLESIADQVSVGLRNARLYARAQKQAEQQLLVNNIRQELQAAGTVTEALEIAGNMIANELNTGTKIKIGMEN